VFRKFTWTLVGGAPAAGGASWAGAAGASSTLMQSAFHRIDFGSKFRTAGL
jgi:hypothetical protein